MSDAAFGVGAHAARPLLSTTLAQVIQIVTEYDVRCTGRRTEAKWQGQVCGALIGEELTRPWTLTCWRCGLRQQRLPRS